MIQKTKDILKRIGSKVKYHLAGGKYGEYMNKRIESTPEGKALQKEIKEKGQWKTLLETIKKRRWFSE